MTNTYAIYTKNGTEEIVNKVEGIGFDPQTRTAALVGENSEYLAVVPIENIDVIVKKEDE